MAFEHYDKCSLLLPMDGANNGTIFTDWSPINRTITRAGNSKTVTSNSKYYGSSGYFDGSGDFLSGGVLDLIGDKFTISTWVNSEDAVASSRILADSGGEASFNSTNGIHFLLQVGASSKYRFQYWNGSSAAAIDTSTGLTINTWQHLAVTWDGTTLRIFLDGILEDSSETAPVRPSTTPTWFFGKINGESSPKTFKGNAQDLVVIKGEALWTSDFTPPTRLIGELSNTSALAPVEDETGTPAERTIIAVPRTYPTRAFGAQSDSNGDFTLRAPATECSVFAIHEGDPIKNDLIQRVIPV